MEKEVGAAGEAANPEISGGFQGFKETVYNSLENFFGWLSTHQSLALIIILIVLGIIIWLLIRAKKYRRQLVDEKYLNKKEITKKDARIEEQEKKLTDLQKKLSDQQGVVSEALMRTMSTLTGYDADQLQNFFKSLIQISENPLQIADTRADTPSGSRLLGAESSASLVGNDTEGEIASQEDTSEEKDIEDKIASQDVTTEEKDIEDKVASHDDTSEEGEIEDKIVSHDDTTKEGDIEDTITSDNETSDKKDIRDKIDSDDSLKTDDPEEKTASIDESSADNDIKDKTASGENPEEEAETKKID